MTVVDNLTDFEEHNFLAGPLDLSDQREEHSKVENGNQLIDQPE